MTEFGREIHAGGEEWGQPQVYRSGSVIWQHVLVWQGSKNGIKGACNGGGYFSSSEGLLGIADERTWLSENGDLELKANRKWKVMINLS